MPRIQPCSVARDSMMLQLRSLLASFTRMSSYSCPSKTDINSATSNGRVPSELNTGTTNEMLIASATRERSRERQAGPGARRGGHAETDNPIDYFILILFGEVIVEGQTEQAIRNSLGYGTGAWPSPETPAHLGKMQRR